MNKFFKVILSILGGVNVVFSMFIPISLALILISLAGPTLSPSSEIIIMITGMLSTIFRAIKGVIN